MSAIIQISESGTIQLPRDLLAQVRCGKPYLVQVEKATLKLTPSDEPEPSAAPPPTPAPDKPFWATATTEEWLAAFHEWVDSHKDGPGLPAEALRRETMYD